MTFFYYTSAAIAAIAAGIACLLPGITSDKSADDVIEAGKMSPVDAIVAIGLGDEGPTIIEAALRNVCLGDDFVILLAIRKSENGSAGREFGILHPKCLKQIQKHPEKSLDIQAGWAAATIVKNRIRWDLAGNPGSFINFLGDRYCPETTADPDGNANWKRNVKYWIDKFKGLTDDAIE
jgi:hypothetical protein